MATYIALLRGINVGEKNRIEMPKLRAMMEEYGFKEVRTYINSGNVIFTSVVENSWELKGICEGLITATFQLTIPVTIVAATELIDARAHAPSWWGVDRQSKHNVIFVIPPTKAEKLINEVGSVKEDFEKVAYYGNLIFWSAPITTFSKTRWSKIVGKPYYNKITIRNANTVNKLVELAQT